jgi:peptidoglycan/LPS O-acetylase OafA/YrhL
VRHASVAPVVALVEPVVPRRRTEVEALRGLAAMGVLLSHCWGIGHDYSGYVFGTRLGRLGLSGGEGLVLFFVLSGYLLTRMFVSGAAKGRPVVLTIYLRHRALRILPTWFLVLAVLLVVHDEGVARSHWWRFPLLLQGFWQDTVIRVDGPAWSLAVEAQFYLLLPLLALLLRRSLALALGTVVVLGTAAAALRLGTVTYDHPTVVWNYSLPANVVYFCPGCARCRTCGPCCCWEACRSGWPSPGRPGPSCCRPWPRA